jgi:hypothetical protein
LIKAATPESITKVKLTKLQKIYEEKFSGDESSGKEELNSDASRFERERSSMNIF